MHKIRARSKDRYMRSDQVYALSVQMEKEGIRGAGEEDLLADDIFAVLEYLQDEGVDLDPLLKETGKRIGI